MTSILFGLFGLSVLVAITWLFSENRRGVDWKLVGIGLALQIAFACFVLRSGRRTTSSLRPRVEPPCSRMLRSAADVVKRSSTSRMGSD